MINGVGRATESIKPKSLLDHGLDLDKFKERQSRIRKMIDYDDQINHNSILTYDFKENKNLFQD